MKEMVGGCCVCSDETGSEENPLVYCDGDGCSVAVHQGCYGIVSVPQGPWFCKRCQSQERAARVICQLCPSKEGAMKRTHDGLWAHVICALYIPEVRFGDLTTMEPIITRAIPAERYHGRCYICSKKGRDSDAKNGACMSCNKGTCKMYFHVTCAQMKGLLVEETGTSDSVKYCGYCQHHFDKIVENSDRIQTKGDKRYTLVSNRKDYPNIKPIPAFKPPANRSPLHPPAGGEGSSSLTSSSQSGSSSSRKPNTGSPRPKSSDRDRDHNSRDPFHFDDEKRDKTSSTASTLASASSIPPASSSSITTSSSSSASTSSSSKKVKDNNNKKEKEKEKDFGKMIKDPKSKDKDGPSSSSLSSKGPSSSIGSNNKGSNDGSIKDSASALFDQVVKGTSSSSSGLGLSSSSTSDHTFSSSAGSSSFSLSAFINPQLAAKNKELKERDKFNSTQPIAPSTSFATKDKDKIDGKKGDDPKGDVTGKGKDKKEKDSISRLKEREKERSFSPDVKSTSSSSSTSSKLIGKDAVSSREKEDAKKKATKDKELIMKKTSTVVTASKSTTLSSKSAKDKDKGASTSSMSKGKDKVTGRKRKVSESSESSDESDEESDSADDDDESDSDDDDDDDDDHVSSKNKGNIKSKGKHKTSNKKDKKEVEKKKVAKTKDKVTSQTPSAAVGNKKVKPSKVISSDSSEEEDDDDDDEEEDDSSSEDEIPAKNKKNSKKPSKPVKKSAKSSKEDVTIKGKNKDSTPTPVSMVNGSVGSKKSPTTQMASASAASLSKKRKNPMMDDDSSDGKRSLLDKKGASSSAEKKDPKDKSIQIDVQPSKSKKAKGNGGKGNGIGSEGVMMSSRSASANFPLINKKGSHLQDPDEDTDEENHHHHHPSPLSNASTTSSTHKMSFLVGPTPSLATSGSNLPSTSPGLLPSHVMASQHHPLAPTLSLSMPLVQSPHHHSNLSPPNLKNSKGTGVTAMSKSNGYLSSSSSASPAGGSTPTAIGMSMTMGHMSGGVMGNRNHPSGHSIDLSDTNVRPTNPFVPPIPPTQRCQPAPSTLTPITTPTKDSTDPPPNSMENLLERQWGQASQFIQDAIAPYDVSNLISCLSQLKQDNERLAERVRFLTSRKDHLMAVTARLALPLNPLVTGGTTTTTGGAGGRDGSDHTPITMHHLLGHPPFPSASSAFNMMSGVSGSGPFSRLEPTSFLMNGGGGERGTRYNPVTTSVGTSVSTSGSHNDNSIGSSLFSRPEPNTFLSGNNSLTASPTSRSSGGSPFSNSDRAPFTGPMGNNGTQSTNSLMHHDRRSRRTDDDKR